MAIDLVLRRDWHARAPHGDYTQLDSTKGVKVHYTGGRVDPGIVNDHAGCVSLVQSIQGYHMDGNGWIDIGYCVDEKTEILTQQGWKSYRDLRAGDIALTLNHELGVSQWQPVLEVCVFPARPREMVRMEGTCHSSLTTPQHRWPVERLRRRTGTERQKGPDGRWLPTEKTARKVSGYDRLWATTETLGYWDRIPIAAPCADLPTETKWSDAFVELVAWFWTEGHIMTLRDGTRATSVALYQSLISPAYIARIRAALTEVFGPSVAAFPRLGRRTDGVPRWRETTNENKTTGKRLAEFHLSADAGRRLLEVAPDRVPSFDFLLTLTRAQLSLFIETSLAADNAGKDKLAQKSRAAAEAFMFAVLLAGHSASLRVRPPTKTCKSDMWLVTIRKQQYLSPRSAASHKRNFEISRDAYDGEIWCPRTENQSWLARRNGSVYFTGNTYVACPHRKVFEGRGLHHLPAANGAGLNSGHYAVLGLVGNAGLVEPPDGLLNGILDAVEYVRERGKAGKEIKGHRDGYSTDCPGEPLYAWVKRGAPRPGGGGGGPDLPTAPPFPGRLLKYPPVTQGEDVRTWQQQMKVRGWEIEVDGAYGSASRDVCRRFQRSVSIDDDGIVGPTTWRLTWEAPLP
ncbi:peptidoglycan-binding protein [Nonomuraea sp. NPDC049158]|uniref:peptidoglycan-binding protein n=1 Tax=Nonomuraea sp. NPDC049158 TaxID=3155649 RepID=UPI0033F981A7